MAFYTVDVRDRVIRRVTHQPSGVDNKRFFVIEAGSAKRAWAKALCASEAIRPKDKLAAVQMGSVACGDCRHRHCQVCEKCSAAKQYSDFWICHCCGELNRRVPNLH